MQSRRTRSKVTRPALPNVESSDPSALNRASAMSEVSSFINARSYSRARQNQLSVRLLDHCDCSVAGSTEIDGRNSFGTEPGIQCPVCCQPHNDEI